MYVCVLIFYTCFVLVVVICSSLMLNVSLDDDTMLVGDCGNESLFAIPEPLANPFVSLILLIFLLFMLAFYLINLKENNNPKILWTADSIKTAKQFSVDKQWNI